MVVVCIDFVLCAIIEQKINRPRATYNVERVFCQQLCQGKGGGSKIIVPAVKCPEEKPISIRPWQ